MSWDHASARTTRSFPGFLTREGEAVGPFGVMGGHMQPQGHVQLVLATVDRRLDPQTALGEARWRWETGRRVFVEPEFGPGPIDALVQRGHDVVVATDRSLFGNGQAIWRRPDGRGYVAGSEPRADGQAAPY